MTVIYIDFESLGATRKSDRADAGTARPLLLGIYRSLSEDGFRQAIIDPALHTADRASRYTRAVSVEGALRMLLADGDVAGDRIVAWSRYDLDVIERHCQSRSLVREIATRYENSLEVARSWRRQIRPSIELPRDHKGRETHRLKAYMAHAGYRVPRVLAAGQAAAWARYVLEQLDRSPRGYRDVKPLAKRRWHYLLQYNFHDCAGLKAVHERARRELCLWEAYKRTTFRILASGCEIDVRIGWSPRQLQKLLDKAGADTWAFITAWNPASVPLSAAENDNRQRELTDEIARRRWPTVRGIGIGEDASWPPEDSVLILGIRRADAVALGRRFGQLGIVFGERQSKAELLACEPDVPPLERIDPYTLSVRDFGD